GKARNIRHLIGDAIAQYQAARPKAFAIASEDGEIVDGAGDAVGPGIDQPDRGIARQLLPRLCQDFQRRLVIMAEQAMRVTSEAVARQTGIENGDLAAGTADLQGGGEAGKAAADDDDVIHGNGLRVVDEALGQGTTTCISDTTWYRNVGITILSRTGIVVTENSPGRRGRPANEALGQTIVDAACELFDELGFHGTTLDMVAQRAKISKLSIYRHFENKEALFSAAFTARCRQLIPPALFEGVDGSAEDQLMAVGSPLLRTLLRPGVRSVEAMIMADK